MLKAYNVLFNMYLKEAKRLAEVGNISLCIDWCEHSSHALHGMIRLMEFKKCISQDKSDIELERVRKTFDSAKICNAFRTRGDIIVLNRSKG